MFAGVANWDATWFLVNLMLESIREEIRTLEVGVGDQGGALLGDVNALRGDVSALRTTVSGLQSTVSALQSSVNGLNQVPLTFAFAGTPVQGSMINLPLTINLAIAAFPNGSRYYNVTNPLTASVFTLTRQPANTTIGTISVSTGGVGTFSGTGSNILSATDTLRMTATTVGGSLANVGITIAATRR